MAKFGTEKKPKIGRNAPCPCGSGKKYKKCCLRKTDAAVEPKKDELDLLMQDGYFLLQKNKTDRACNMWLDLWSKLKIIFKPEFKNVEEAEALFSGEELVYNWCQDLEIELGNAALDDPSYYMKRIEYCSDFCSIFPESDNLLIHNMKRAVAESHFALGDISKGDECFKSLIAEYPKNIWGYIGWGDMYAWPLKKDITPDYEKAENIYNLAINMELEDKSDLIDRLKELKIERDKTT
jgi:tetratricopeptide (TPR) repeat protein